MSKQYSYSPLATKSTVRLIKLEKLKVEDRIACKILHAEQSTAEYDALSYVWGDDTPVKDIAIYSDDDHEWTSFRVHENLWQFLNNAWERGIFDRWLWTDRICLNQNDETEKREQIPRMADIYHNAVQVIAWSGLSATEEENLLPVRNFLQTLEYWIEDNWQSRFSDESALAASKVMLYAEYWKRVWVVQEVVSAKKIVCFIGHMDMTFDEVKALGPLAQRGAGFPKAHWFGVHSFLRDVSKASKDGHAPNLDLWDLLKTVTRTHFKSRTPHDRVYGILGLAANLSDGTSPRAHIGVDYGKPPADVFLDAILESHIPWKKWSDYETAIDLLLDRPDNANTWEPIFTFLTRYSESSRTSQRHRKLAKLVLSASDALYLLASIPGSPPGDWSTKQAFSELNSRFGDHFRLERTAQHSAVMLGVALSFVIDDKETMRQMFADWKSCRHFRLMGHSPWRCAAHQLPVRAKAKAKMPFQHIDQPKPGVDLEIQMAQYIEWYQSNKRKQATLGLREYHGSMELIWNLGLKPSFEKICGGFKKVQGSRSCDGSILSCEFPEANFRLQVSNCEYVRGGWSTERIHVSFLLPDLH